jgi:hypothetical protein
LEEISKEFSQENATVALVSCLPPHVTWKTCLRVGLVGTAGELHGMVDFFHAIQTAAEQSSLVIHDTGHTDISPP